MHLLGNAFLHNFLSCSNKPVSYTYNLMSGFLVEGIWQAGIFHSTASNGKKYKTLQKLRFLSHVESEK